VCRTAILRAIIVHNYTLVASNNINFAAVVARIIKESRTLFDTYIRTYIHTFKFCSSEI
jgi:hypothetical protein